MAHHWPEFDVDRRGLHLAVDRLSSPAPARPVAIPPALPQEGIGDEAALEAIAAIVLDGARDLGAPGFFAHMDPPTPWITWAVSQWTASRNQNLLHPDTAPMARQLEETVIGWFAPFFGMTGGHMTAGSTLANITALWAAREAGAAEVVAGADAHLSVKKAAHLLGMPFRAVDWDEPGDLTRAAAVITAGVTSTGEIESLDAAADARWRHVDGAWSGPLRLSDRYAGLLDGVERADSVCLSAHKWLFQPKESALILFADAERAHRSVSVDAPYMSVTNVGLLGSHGAVAAPLAATVLAYGRAGIAAWIDHTMRLADQLHELVDNHPQLEARSEPRSGVLNWRHRSVPTAAIRTGLADDVFVSITTIDGEPWLRSVAANPNADPHRVVEGVLAAAIRVR